MFLNIAELWYQNIASLCMLFDENPVIIPSSHAVLFLYDACVLYFLFMLVPFY